MITTLPSVGSSGPAADPPDVALLRWPQEEALRRQVAAARLPRLLLIGPGEAPPLGDDELEDWVRFPLDPEELAVRTATLVERARHVLPRSVALVLDADGVLHLGDRWVGLAPIEVLVLAPLLERPGEVIHRSDLTRAAWPSTTPADERALDGAVKRLRRRVAPLGVRIHTITGVGFLLDAVS